MANTVNVYLFKSAILISSVFPSKESIDMALAITTSVAPPPSETAVPVAQEDTITTIMRAKGEEVRREIWSRKGQERERKING